MSHDVGSIKNIPELDKTDKMNHLNKGNILIIAYCCGLNVLIISHCCRDGKKNVGDAMDGWHGMGLVGHGINT
jgi:hypothetical protein